MLENPVCDNFPRLRSLVEYVDGEELIEHFSRASQRAIFALEQAVGVGDFDALCEARCELATMTLLLHALAICESERLATPCEVG